TGWVVPPNSQGYLTIGSAAVIDRLEPPDDPEDPRSWHLAIEAYRSLAVDRNDLVSDPKFAPEPPGALVSDERIAERARRVDPGRAGDFTSPSPAPGGTAYLAVIDAAGLAVSFIQSNFMGIGSGLGAGDAGFFLHNRGAGFDLRPGHPNELRPGRRPMHTLAPTLWTRRGSLDLVLGTRGGDQQPQLLMQFAAAHYHAGTSIEDTQQLPRWTMSLPAHTGSQIDVEARFPEATVGGLVARGHSVTAADEWMAGWGPISAIDAGGGMRGAADPRVTTSAAISG
ncbi:MAG: gamma-glutamyltranspeptidase, partial [Actinobacteria bacterium]